MELDENAKKIIDSMAKEIAERSVKALRCCRERYEVGMDVDPVLLNRVIANCRVVFLAMYSPVCPYCELFYPIFVEVGRKYSSYAAFVRMNAYKHPEIAMSLGVETLPSTAVIIDGVPRELLVGYIDGPTFESIVVETLRKAGCIEQ